MSTRREMSLRDAKMIWRGRDAYQWECHWRTFRGMVVLLIATAVAMPYASPGRQGIALGIFLGSMLVLTLALRLITKGLHLLADAIRWLVGRSWHVCANVLWRWSAPRKGPGGKPSP